MAMLMKKELIFKGLNCKKCIKDIKNKIRARDLKINIDYNNKTLSVITNEGIEYNKIMGEINYILGNHKHKVQVNEQHIENDEYKTLYIEKLTCSDCARKIETKVNNIDGVEEASIDFVNSKMNISLNSKHDVGTVIGKIKATIQMVDPDVYITEEKDLEDGTHSHENDQGVVEKTIVTLIMGGIFFTLGLLLKTEMIYKFILYFLSYIVIGRTVVFKAIRNILKGKFFDENTLMMVATLGAFIIGEYHEAVAVMAFYLVGEMFQDLAVDKSRKSITKLMDIKSDFSNVKKEDQVIKMKTELVEIGSLIIVKPGERIPLDGIVVEGKSHVDTSSITGESLPKFLKQGSDAISGYINNDGLLVIETTKVYESSTVNKILEMVESSSKKKAPTERFITRFARFYTPIVVLIAFVIAVFVPLILKEDFNIWIYRALSFLVVSCPCALVISAPLAFYSGIGIASRNGILIKGGNYLEALRKADEIVFDKTGTITMGNFSIKHINPINYSEYELLEIAALTEYYSLHPIAMAIKNQYTKPIDYNRISKYQEIAGFGIRALIDNKEVLMGNQSLMERYEIKFSRISDTPNTVLYIATDGIYAGYIEVGDMIKKEASSAINRLKKQGIKKISMITGDKQSVANYVSSHLGIDEVYAETLPNEKVEIVENKVKNSSNKIIYVGDGINDAPVLAISDVGISMGRVGSDAAIEASDVVIMNDDLNKIADAKYISKKTSMIVWQNIIFALTIKILVLVLAAFGIVTMWAAVFADVGVSLVAILNTMRILKIKIKK